MSQEGNERNKGVECDGVGPTALSRKVAGWTGAVLFFGSIAVYYAGAVVFAVWSWLVLFGRVRGQAAELGLVAWLVLLVGLFHFVGVVFLKHRLVLAVEPISAWVGNTIAAWRERIRRNLARREARVVVEWDEETVHCRHIDDEVESVWWADVEAVWVITTAWGPWLDDVFYVLEGTEGRCTVPSEALGAPGLIERLTQLSGFNHDAYTQAIRCTDNKRFLVWRRHDGRSAAGDQT